MTVYTQQDVERIRELAASIDADIAQHPGKSGKSLAGAVLRAAVVVVVACFFGLMIFGAGATVVGSMSNAQVAADSTRDLNTILLDLDAFIRSRGVGTRHEQTLFENPGAFRTERRQLEEMIARLTVAPDSASRLATIPEAEALRLRVRKLLDSEE